MKTLATFKTQFNLQRKQIMFKKDQKIWCAIFGEGVVVEIQPASGGAYPVEVRFNDGRTCFYTSDGKYCANSSIVLFPYPIEITKATIKPSVDWNHVSEDFQYLAMDEDGLHHLFAEKPEPTAAEWTTHALYIYAGHFASFSAGTCNWEDSLVKRPN